LATYGILTVPQLARLEGVSERTMRGHCRTLFDGEVIDTIVVPRAALAAPEDGNDPALAFGSAPGIFVLSPNGRRAAAELGIEVVARPASRYGPRNGLFLAHELAVRDFAVWLELTARGYPGHRLAAWRDGTGAWIDLGRTGATRQLRPDAWFVYALGARVLVGLVEIDRGTERGLATAAGRWKQKLEGYRELYASGRLKATTGYRNARVLAVASSARRRDSLAEFAARHAPGELAARFWVAHAVDLALPGLSRPVWCRPGSDTLVPLLPPELLGPGPQLTDEAGNQNGKEER
jgi:hypothetical protein